MVRCGEARESKSGGEARCEKEKQTALRVLPFPFSVFLFSTYYILKETNTKIPSLSNQI
jgi:hypothetical protein